MTLTAPGLLVAAALCYLLGAGLSFLTAPRQLLSHRVAYLSAAIASFLGLAGALGILWSGEVVTASLFALRPLGDFSVRVDALSALFIATTGLVGLAVSVYSLGYARHYVGRKAVGTLGTLFNLFLLSMGLVPATSNVLAFVLAWELMALVSFLLVVFEHERDETTRAAIFYAVMTQLGTGFLIGAFLLLGAHANSMAFEDIARASSSLSPIAKSLAFLAFVVGFGAKAGIVPLHGWLPEAHPAAPSHVSALMSAVMIKTGVYGLIRVTFELLGGPLPWWGMLLIGLGALSAVLGALYAVVEPDLKRLLAYSSIENVGIILMGLGAAVTFHALGKEQAAGLALVASLYHLVNHAQFKSLLFCGAGAVLHATHTRRLDELGGLIRRMPQTAVLFLVGTVAIAALPPFNGFVSEWLTFQALLFGAGLDGPFMHLVLPLAAAALALTGGLAMAAFVKAFATAFLALPRSEGAAQATEAPVSMRLGMAIPALACLLMGLLAGPMVTLLGRVSARVLGIGAPPPQPVLAIQVGFGGMATPVIWLALGMSLCLALVLPRLLGGRTRTRRAATWGCGVDLGARTQYSAMGFAQPLRAVFGRLLLPHSQEVQVDETLPPYFKREMRYRVYLEPVFERFLYAPVVHAAMRISATVTKIQTGSIHLYLAYMFATLLLVLLLLKRLG